MASLSKMRVVMYEKQIGLFGMLGAASHAAPPGANSIGSINVGGTNVHLDMNSIRELMTPKLMYLWRGR